MRPCQRRRPATTISRPPSTVPFSAHTRLPSLTSRPTGVTRCPAPEGSRKRLWNSRRPAVPRLLFPVALPTALSRPVGMNAFVLRTEYISCAVRPPSQRALLLRLRRTRPARPWTLPPLRPVLCWQTPRSTWASVTAAPRAQEPGDAIPGALACIPPSIVAQAPLPWCRLNRLQTTQYIPYSVKRQQATPVGFAWLWPSRKRLEGV